ncbi:MAG: YgjV family protein [Ruminococcaceae bacterium]|nr:YgjV family protein [Oscillospiraceae bacterium]
MTLEIVGQIFGILTTIAAVVSAQLPKRWQMMIGYMAVNLFSALNVLFVGGGLTGCLVCLVAVAHSSVNAYRAKKDMDTPLTEKLIFSVVYFVAWGIGFYLSWKSGVASWLDALPLVATVFFVASMLVKKENNIRLWTLGNASVNTVYHLMLRSSGIFAQLFELVSIIVALFRYRKKPPKNGENVD